MASRRGRLCAMRECAFFVFFFFLPNRRRLSSKRHLSGRGRGSGGRRVGKHIRGRIGPACTLWGHTGQGFGRIFLKKKRRTVRRSGAPDALRGGGRCGLCGFAYSHTDGPVSVTALTRSRAEGTPNWGHFGHMEPTHRAHFLSRWATFRTGAESSGEGQ